MRERQRILDSLEAAYREAFEAARERGDEVLMSRLDLDFQRDQIQLEVLLDLRELLAQPDADEKGGDRVKSLLGHAETFKKLTRLR